jgi:hypothetical protein
VAAKAHLPHMLQSSAAGSIYLLLFQLPVKKAMKNIAT